MRYREEIEAKPERDPVTCSQCDREATQATPEGGMCDRHAEELAEAMGR